MSAAAWAADHQICLLDLTVPPPLLARADQVIE
jgi:hypothetical protein